MPLKRVNEWRERLGQILLSAQELEFQWGTFDCALHVCNCIRAVTGTDPAAQYRGTYSDQAGAEKIYGSSLVSFIATTAASLGCPEVPVTFARRGDVVWIDNGTEQGAIGVVHLDGRFISCASEKGIVLVHMRRWRRAWQIG
jgi:hypothetical protein